MEPQAAELPTGEVLVKGHTGLYDPQHALVDRVAVSRFLTFDSWRSRQGCR